MIRHPNNAIQPNPTQVSEQMRHLVEHSNVLLRPGEEGVARHTPVSLLVHGHGAPLADISSAPETLKTNR